MARMAGAAFTEAAMACSIASASPKPTVAAGLPVNLSVTTSVRSDITGLPRDNMDTIASWWIAQSRQFGAHGR